MDNLIFTSESVILYERKRIHALKYEEIICITTDRPYLVITTVESLQMFIQMSLSKVGELLPDYFCLCNPKYLRPCPIQSLAILDTLQLSI